jgi:hypothetical protein
LFVPIISTTTWGIMPTNAPFSIRQSTFWVVSPPMPKFAAFRGA